MALDKHISRKQVRRLMRDVTKVRRAASREARRPCTRSDDHAWEPLENNEEQCMLCGTTRVRWCKRRTPPYRQRQGVDT